MKTEFIKYVPVVLTIMLLACGQAIAGELPSQGDAPKTAGPSIIQTDGAGLTAEQAQALAAIGPAGEEAYGDTDETTQVIVVATVCIIAIIVVAAVVGWHDWR